MAVPLAAGKFNKAVTNKVLIHLAGHGPFVELEHVGRRSGTVYRIPLNAFRRDDVVTVVLPYGRKVDWFRNVTAAGGARMRMGQDWLTLGPPTILSRAEGLARLAAVPRAIIRTLGVKDFAELPVLRTEPVHAS